MSPAPVTIQELVERFHDNRDDYRSPTYNEAQLRQEFLNPFFAALGWDVYNTQGYAEPYKDVIHEYSLPKSGETRTPDYLFRVGPMPKFFVEAKKPAVNLKQDPMPAYQLRRYAWSAKLPLSDNSTVDDSGLREIIKSAYYRESLLIVHGD